MWSARSAARTNDMDTDKAVEDDHKYFASLGKKNPGLIPFYAAHDHHMLAYAALMTGQSKLAMDKIREALSEMPAEFVKVAAVKAEAFFALPLEAMIRFGKWDDVLAEPENYAEYMPFSRAYWLSFVSHSPRHQQYPASQSRVACSPYNPGAAHSKTSIAPSWTQSAKTCGESISAQIATPKVTSGWVKTAGALAGAKRCASSSGIVRLR